MVLCKKNTINARWLISTTQSPFKKTVYDNNKEALTRGVTNHLMRGIPPYVIQEEINPKKSQIDTRGTVKAAVPEGYPKFPEIIESSVCDTKTVH